MNGTENNTFWVDQEDKTQRHECIMGWAWKGKLLNQEKWLILLIFELLFFDSPYYNVDVSTDLWKKVHMLTEMQYVNLNL